MCCKYTNITILKDYLKFCFLCNYNTPAILPCRFLREDIYIIVCLHVMSNIWADVCSINTASRTHCVKCTAWYECCLLHKSQFWWLFLFVTWSPGCSSIRLVLWEINQWAKTVEKRTDDVIYSLSWLMQIQVSHFYLLSLIM